MKIGCRCGHVIRDQTDELPYKAHVLKDQDYPGVLEGIISELEDYIDGFRKGLRDGTTKLRDTRVIMNAWIKYFQKHCVDIYECEACGRLLLGRDTKSNEFAFYVPEDAGSGKLLRSEFSPMSENPDLDNLISG
jgi:hypothetical protein